MHARIVRWLPWALVAVVAVACSASFLGRSYSEWESVYVPAAARVWAGGQLYRHVETYLYPPLAALLALPWVFLPAPVGRVAWFAVSAASVYGMLRLGWSLAGGARRDDAPADWTAWGLGLACGAAFLQNSWAHQQTDIPMAALQLAGLALLLRRRELSAGALFGVAAAVKCTPLLWLLYLVWRGRFAAAGCLLAVAVGFSLLPDLVSRPESGTWLGRYASQVAGHSANVHLGIWGTDPLYNQSLAGTSLRALAVEAVPVGGGFETRFHPEWVSAATHRRLVQAAMLALLAVTLVCAGRPGRVPEEGGEALAWEGAIVLLLALLFSPMSGPAHFGVLILPGFLLARRARIDPRCYAFLGVGVTLALLNARDLVGAWVYSRSLLYGSVTLATLTLLAGCCRELVRLRWRRPAVAHTTLRRAA